MAVQGSVLASLVSGLNTINLPADNLTIVGIYPFGAQVGIQTSPGKFAYPPAPTPTINPGPQMIKVHYKMSTSQLLVQAFSSGTIVIYYGTPLSGSVPLEKFTGVLTTVNFAASGSTSQTATVTMPKSGATLRGFVAYEAQTGFEYSIQWNTSTGKSLTFYSVPGQSAHTSDIVELEIPDTAISFSVTVDASSTSAANSVNFILYYQ